MDIFSVVVRFFQEGGAFMYPIALVFAIGMAIAIERWLFLTKSKVTNKKAFGDILPMLRKNSFDEVLKYANNSSAPIARIIAAGIDKMNVTPRREEVEYAMEEGIMEVMPRLEKRTGYLAILANVATLMGLLGTIMGLIAAFTAVANADPAEKANLLSQSISVAMNTTAFGLISAIPLLLLHSWLQTKTTEIVDSIEMAGVKFLNTLSASVQSSPGARSSDAA